MKTRDDISKIQERLSMSQELLPTRDEVDLILSYMDRPMCFYCVFGEQELVTADQLQQHIEAECEFHPIPKLKRQLAEVQQKLIDAEELHLPRGSVRPAGICLPLWVVR